MTRNIENLENPQLKLFDQDEPSISFAPAKRAQLATLVEALLAEIAAALATWEADDEQGHG